MLEQRVLATFKSKDLKSIVGNSEFISIEAAKAWWKDHYDGQVWLFVRGLCGTGILLVLAPESKW